MRNWFFEYLHIMGYGLPKRVLRLTADAIPARSLALAGRGAVLECV